MSQVPAMFTDGEAYERLMGRWSRLVGIQFIDWLKPPEGLRWLDAGCGNGAFTEEIFAHGHPTSVVGIDPSPPQIAYAKTRSGISKAEFQVGDAQALPFPDLSFDVAVMALVIAFIPDAAKAVAELARVVKPGGLVATYMWDLPAGVPTAPIYKAMGALGYTLPLPPNAAAAKKDALEGIWKNAGLTNVQTTVIHIETSFESFDALWETLTIPVGPLGIFVAGLPEPARQELRSLLKNQLNIQEDGRVAYQSFANAVKGIKAK